MSQQTDPMAEASGDARMLSAGVAAAACRINALSSDVLIRAISFLDARQLVQTCVLSRRWRDLWRSVTRISASCDEFDGMAGTEEACDVLFKRFMNRFLMLRNPAPLDEFRLRYNIPVESADPYADSEDANLWIRHALQSNAQFVDVSGCSMELHLDPVVFASKCCFVTTMQLSLVLLQPTFFKNLQTGCTLLERLILCCCIIDDPEISSHTLKVLTIDPGCVCIFEGRASISIPSLIDLEFSPEDPMIPLLKNMESLVTASFSLGTNDDQVDDPCQFLWSLQGVRDLEFSYKGRVLEMQQNLQWCPKFNNLTNLTLGGWCLYQNLYPLIVFLQNSPNLEQLTLKLRNGFSKLKVEQNLQWCPKFNNLTTLTLGDWCLYGNFYPLIVFLQKSPNLEKLTLKLGRGLRKFYPDGGFIGVLEERSFTCEHLVMVEIAFINFRLDPMGSKVDHVVNSLVVLLCDNNSITPDQISIKNRFTVGTDLQIS